MRSSREARGGTRGGDLPRWVITFDAEGGDGDGKQGARIAEEAHAAGVRDLVVIAHTGHSDADTAAGTDDRFHALFAAEAAGPAEAAETVGSAESADGSRTGLGFVSVHWPGMRCPPEPRLTDTTEAALSRTFPGAQRLVGELRALLDERPVRYGAVDDVGMMLRRLVEAPLQSDVNSYATDMSNALLPQSDPAMLFDSAVQVCEGFAHALEQAGEEAEREAQRPERIEQPSTGAEAPAMSKSGTLAESETAGPRPADAPDAWLSRPEPLGPRIRPFGVTEVGEDPDRLWDGAHQFLCQAVSYAIRRRAALIGERGLAPALGRIAEALPDTRVHLVGHGAGARLVAYAARGLGGGAHCVGSLTLLQAAFSHFAFTGHLPNQLRGGGGLAEVAHRVAGPVVCGYSHHDLELGLLFPLASRLLGESPPLVGAGRVWGALGYDGAQGVEGCPTLTLADALAEDALPRSGCVNVDTSAVVRGGAPPLGAHDDVFHRELARLVFAAGRIPGAGTGEGRGGTDRP
ncbi:serine-threonine protein kinase [Streptomyces silvensis]|uniref:serine-threonine protein kinase n=1 Tax=Streptomyces silvensis TaxID=1765722 RepID=UPI000A7B0C60|nr:serine-threonine protein kinase [Streptomyces silvensis]